MNTYSLLFKDFVVLKPNRKEPQAGNSKYGNISIANNINSANDLGGLLNNNIVLVDLDNQREGELLLNLVKSQNIRCIVIKTDRGYHFYFRSNEEFRNESHLISALGLTIDIKCSNGNKIAYAIIKRNGVLRPIVYGENFTELDSYPLFLRPIKQNDMSKFQLLYEMGDGDGRNNYLHNYLKFVLNGNGFNNDEIKQIFYLINDYILGEPLSQREIDTIAREEEVYTTSQFQSHNRYRKFNSFDNYEEEDNHKNKKQSKQEKRKFICYDIATSLVEEKHIIRLENEGKDDLFYYYDDNHYKLFINDSVIKSLILSAGKEKGELLSKSEIDTVFTYIQAETPRLTREALANEKRLFLATNNKLIVFNKDRSISIEEPTPSIFCTCKINVNYNQEAKGELIDRFFKDISNDNPKTEQLLKEVIGYCLYPKNIFRKSFFLIGSGGNGKSTYQNLIKDFLGYGNASNINLFDIENNRFAPANLKDKLANLGDDINKDDFSKLSNFKTISSGDTLSAEFKGGQAFSFQPFCKLIYSANSAPILRDSSEGIASRVIFIPFNKKFINNNKIKALDYISELTTKENKEYLLQICLLALEDLLNRGYFEESEEAEELTKDALRESDSVYAFLCDLENQGDTIYDKKISLAYNLFKRYCLKNGIDLKMSNTAFSKKVKSYYPNIISYKKFIDGKTTTIFYGTTDEIISLTEKEEEKTEEENEEEEEVEEKEPTNNWGDKKAIKKSVWDSLTTSDKMKEVDKITNKDLGEILLFDDLEFTEDFTKNLIIEDFVLTQINKRLILQVPKRMIHYIIRIDNIPAETAKQEILKEIKNL